MRTGTGRNPDHLDTSIFRFVSEELQEFRPALIVNIFGQEPAGKRSHCKIFDSDQAELRDKPSAYLVPVIPPQIADPFVLTSQE